MSAEFPEKGQTVWGRGKSCKGVATGATRACTLEGCRGTRVYVQWSVGSQRTTYPCIKGMKYNPEDDSWEIE